MKKRLAIYNTYRERLDFLEQKKLVRLPKAPAHCHINGHMFYMICGSSDERERLIKYLKARNILIVTHYVPLHTSPMGRKYGKSGSLPVTDYVAERLVRLPMFYALTDEEQDYVIEHVTRFYEERMS